MKKVLASLLALFCIGTLPMLMGPTGGYPYNPLFGNPTALGFATIGSNAGVFTSLNGSITFGPDSAAHTGAITNTATTMQIASGARDIQLSSSSATSTAIDLEASSGKINFNSNQFRIDPQTTSTTGLVIQNSWLVPKTVSGEQSGGAGVCTVAANPNINMPGSCAYVSAGRYTFTFANAFAQVPSCTGAIIGNPAYIYVATISASAVTYQTLNSSAVATDETFFLTCLGV